MSNDFDVKFEKFKPKKSDYQNTIGKKGKRFQNLKSLRQTKRNKRRIKRDNDF